MSFKADTPKVYVLKVGEKITEVEISLTKEEAQDLNNALKKGKINNKWILKSKISKKEID